MKHNRTSKTIKDRKREDFIFNLIVLSIILLLCSLAPAHAGKRATDAWVICKPGDYIIAREWPNRKGDGLGQLDTGYPLHLDGKTKNGFAHCIDTALEKNDCWVYSGYIVFSEPEWMNGEWYTIEAGGRVQARRYIDGPRLCWLKPGTELQVFWISEEWSVTTRGFIKTEFLQKK